jgi:hypothetical protein
MKPPPSRAVYGRTPDQAQGPGKPRKCNLQSCEVETAYLQCRAYPQLFAGTNKQCEATEPVNSRAPPIRIEYRTDHRHDKTNDHHTTFRIS